MAAYSWNAVSASPTDAHTAQRFPTMKVRSVTLLSTSGWLAPHTFLMLMIPHDGQCCDAAAL
jgi:hypothetical protein